MKQLPRYQKKKKQLLTNATNDCLETYATCSKPDITRRTTPIVCSFPDRLIWFYLI